MDLTELPHERLRRMLDRAELSNREVAEALEVAPETVSRWRSGQSEMRRRDLRAIVTLLGTRGVSITTDWVLTGVDPFASDDGGIPLPPSGPIPFDDEDELPAKKRAVSGARKRPGKGR